LDEIMTMNFFYRNHVLLLVLMSSLFADIKPQKVIYKTVGELELYLNIYYPENSSKSDLLPVMIFFHGGGWNGGSPNQFSKHSSYLASRGLIAMSVRYRLKRTDGASRKETVADAKSAVRYVYTHAEELGVDKDHILTGGGSAGGHLALATTTLHNINDENDDVSLRVPVKAHVLFNPVYDNGPDGYGHRDVKSFWQDFSPFHNINKDMGATLVMFGDQDKLMKVDRMKEFKAKMEAVGVRSDLMIYEGKAHGFFNGHLQTIIDMDVFLASLGYLEGPPTFVIPKEDEEKTNKAKLELGRKMAVAAKKGDLGAVSQAIDKGADPNSKVGPQENTALILAILSNKTEVIRLLVDLGADIHVKNKQGRSALDVATSRKNKEALAIFEEHI
jgi:acetyl esterase/lipase